MSSLSMYFPSSFDLGKAIFLNYLANTAYDMYNQWGKQHKPRRDRFHWEPKGPQLNYSQPIWGDDKNFFGICDAEEPFAFIASDKDNTVYLVFRGTESPSDWSENIKARHTSYSFASGYGKVHGGFFSIYKTMSSKIHAHLAEIPNPKKLYITGHSLGSSLSTLAVPDIITNTNYIASLPVIHYNLASPRVEDSAFAEAYNANGVLTYRIVNTCDAVPTVPVSATSKDLPIPLYKHIGIPVNFTAQYGSIVGNHSVSNSYLYALKNPDQPENPRSEEGEI